VVLVVLLMIAAFLLVREYLPTAPHRLPRQSTIWRGKPEFRPEWRSEPRVCPAPATSCKSRYFAAHWREPTAPDSCVLRMKSGYPEPDPACTPGGVDPAVTLETLRDPHWRTSCIRNCSTSESGKHAAYEWYGLRPPRGNFGPGQTCELDHLVPLELGGADGMGNIWPQCGPAGAPLALRYFKIKDEVEDYLADQVRGGRMPLADAQRKIADDWTQFIPAAKQYCDETAGC
jgi:hypothetical protein